MPGGSGSCNHFHIVLHCDRPIVHHFTNAYKTVIVLTDIRQAWSSLNSNFISRILETQFFWSFGNFSTAKANMVWYSGAWKSTDRQQSQVN